MQPSRPGQPGTGAHNWADPLAPGPEERCSQRSAISCGLGLGVTHGCQLGWGAVSSSSHHGRQRTIPLEGLYHLAQGGLSSQRLPQHLMVSSLSGQSSECWLVLGMHPNKQLRCLMQSVGLRKIVTEELGSIIEIS